jgi:DNA polymerase III subunit delta
MGPSEFTTAVHKGKRFDVVLLRGAEDYLLREALEAYRSAAMPAEAAAFDLSELRSQDIDGKTLWNAVTTLPLLGERRLVILEIGSELKGDLAEAVKRYVAHPAKTTSFVMVMASDAGKDARMPSSVVDVEFPQLRDEGRASWAKRYAAKLKKKITDDALQYLVDSSSHGLADLASKLDHAALFIGTETEISTQVLMRVSGVSSEYTVYNLEEAIFQKKPVQAHRIARSLLEGGEALLRLLAFHRSTIFKLWQTGSILKRPAEWQKGEEGQQALKDVFKRQIFKSEDFKRAAARYGTTRLREAVVELMELEVRLKTGSQDPYLYYEWLWRITSSARALREPGF